MSCLLTIEFGYTCTFSLIKLFAVENDMYLPFYRNKSVLPRKSRNKHKPLFLVSFSIVKMQGFDIHCCCV